MPKGTFKFAPGAAVRLMNSAATRAELDALAQAVKARADAMLPADAAPFEADVQEGTTRAHAMVKTSSDDGTPGFRNRQAQARGNILLKAGGVG
jgi:hypothetical protein